MSPKLRSSKLDFGPVLNSVDSVPGRLDLTCVIDRRFQAEASEGAAAGVNDMAHKLSRHDVIQSGGCEPLAYGRVGIPPKT